VSAEIETGGALVTATLAADALQPLARHGAGAPAPMPCLNCGTPLTGAFCSHCGQRAHLHRTIGDVVHEVVHGITHFDGRFWKTLPMLLFRPGLLTRSYIEGRRARYIAPVPTFLMVVFFMFFALSFISWNEGMLAVNIGNGETASQDERGVAKALEAIDRDLAAALAAGNSSEVTVLQAARRVIAGTAPPAGGAAPAGPRPSITDRLSAEIAAAAARGEITVDLGSPTLDERARQALTNPKLVLYKVQTRAYKLSFLLVPLSLPWLWLALCSKRGVTLYDHVIFTLYSISFISLLFILGSGLLAAGIVTPWVWLPLFLAPSVHMFAQLRGAYALRWWGAAWRTACLMLAALLTLCLYLVLLVLMGVLD
jgi:hypothetical protein